MFVLVLLGVLLVTSLAIVIAGMYYLSRSFNLTQDASNPPAAPSILQATPIITPGSTINKGTARIELAYADRTDLSDVRVKANTDSDIQYVTEIINSLPIIGSPLVSLSAQERYGYTFPAVNSRSIATYDNEVNQLFINMEKRDEHVILHEMAHYLDAKNNTKNLASYLTETVLAQAAQAGDSLLDSIRIYDTNPQTGADDIVNQKIQAGMPVTREEIVNAANVYPTEIWQNPQDFLQFQGQEDIDLDKVKNRADQELYAEFTAFLLRAQKAGVYDYQHPVYKIFQDVKADLTQ